MEAKLYNQKGKESGKINLPETVFGMKWNSDLVHQVAKGMEANARINYADARTRGDVRGGGKKPWKQKGTGRARHGSSRSPIWRGGGVTHGPLADKNYSQKINRKMKMQALFVALSRKLKDEQIIFVDEMTLSKIKTKDAAEIVQALAGVKGFEKLAKARKPVACVIIPESDILLKKSLRNIPSVQTEEIKNVNVVDVLKYRYLVMVKPGASVSFLESKLEK